MKKYFRYAMMAALVGGLSLGYVACSDDDDETGSITNVTVDEDLIAHGLQVNPAGETITVNVKMEGTWTATIENGTEGQTEWATIANDHLSFNGSRTLKVDFTPNATGADRTATLELFGMEGDPITIAIRQQGAGTNAAGSALAFQDQGLGHGVDLAYTFDTSAVKRLAENGAKFDYTHIRTANMVYNMEQIQKLVNNGTLNKGAYSEANFPIYDLKASLVDSTVAQNKDFGVGINMNLTFGFIEFAAGVTYQAKKSEKRGHVDYAICRHAPMYNAVVSPLEIATYASDQSIDAMEKYGEEYEKLEEQVAEKYGSWENLQKKNPMIYKSWKKKLDKYRPDFGNVFSTGFATYTWEYYKAMINDDEEAARKALANIDEAFSPFFITGGNWGGSLNVLVRIDTFSLQGKDTLWAELKGDLSQFGSVSGELHLSTEGLNLYRNAKINVQLLGGSPKVGDEITAWLLSPSVTDYTRLQKSLANWIDTMVSPTEAGKSESAAIPIEFFYTPVWELFESDYKDFARDWFYEKYKNNTSVSAFFGISDGTREDAEAAGHTMAGNL